MISDEQKINLAGLWPDFDSFPGWPETAEQLSAWFVVVLIAVTGIFFLVSLWSFLKARSRTQWLYKLLGNAKSESIGMQRQALRDQANKMNNGAWYVWKKGAGHVWKEFEETLIELRIDGKVQLHSIYEANAFFNASTLAKEITENRMLAAVPGFLTALGVIGTFVGLQLGLSELNIGNGVAVEEMKAGLAHVIGGAKIAFMTSVWGVTLSVLFNFIEKGFEGWARSRIHRLQVRIDALFPRFSAENQLQKIAEDGKQSRESLQGMAEQIGEKMQESLLEATAGIQHGLEASLEKIMAPAMDKLVNDSADGSQKALEQLVEKFLDKFGEQGNAQREALGSASDGMGEALSSMKQTLEGFVGSLNNNHVKSAQREQKLVEHISTQVDKLVEKNAEHGNLLMKVARYQVNKITETLGQSSEDQAERETRLGDKFEQVVTGMGQSMERQSSATTSLLEQGKMLQQQVNSSQGDLAELSESIHKGALELRSSATELKEFGEGVKQASSQLGGVMHQAAETTKGLAGENQKATKVAQHIYRQMSVVITNLKEVAENLEQSTKVQDESGAKLSKDFEKVMVGVNNSSNDQSKATASLLEQGRLLQQQVESGQADLAKLSEGIHQGASDLHSAATELKGFGEGVKNTSEQLSGVIYQATKSTAELARENQKSTTAVGQIHQRISHDIENLNGVVETLNSVVAAADSTFVHLEKHQRDYLAGLQENVRELAEDGSKLLKEYAEQANAQTAEHLGVWAQHTTQYAEQMNRAANALSSVVDEIEDKVSR
ncbi:MAG: anti-phage ZorAB system protein ZorA [Gammaproteobacteria bacterium]|nr:anti-phage ZorAB system protein ZorA [Gammaproteobacteria bacterium]